MCHEILCANKTFQQEISTLLIIREIEAINLSQLLTNWLSIDSFFVANELLAIGHSVCLQLAVLTDAPLLMSSCM